MPHYFLNTILVAGLLLGSACSMPVGLAMAGAPANDLEQLRRQLNAQGQRIKELESLVATQGEAIRRLPVVANSGPPPRPDGTQYTSDEDSDETSDKTGDDTTDNQPAATGEEGSASVVLRLARLEDSILGLQKKENEFLESPSTTSRRVVSGRIHIDQWGFPRSSPGINTLERGNPNDAPMDRLSYRRLRFGVGGSVLPGNMSYRLEIEFTSQDDTNFRDAWIGWDDLVFFNTLRLGNQKRPYGFDHLNSSNFNLFMERPFVDEAFNEDNRRFGLVSYGVSDNQAFNWRYGVYNMDLIQASGSTISNAPPMEFAWRLANTFWYDETSGGRGYGHLGLAGTFAFPDGDPSANGATNGQARFRTRPEGRSTKRWLDTGYIAGVTRYQLLGVESVINVGRFQFVGEIMNLWAQRTGDRAPDLQMNGGYFYLSYFLTGEHIPWNRDLGILGRVEPFEDFFHVNTRNGSTERGLGAWQVATRLSYADLGDEDVLGGMGRSVTFALNWYWNDHAKLQFNYIFGRIDNRRVTAGSIASPAVSGSYEIAGARCVIDF